MPELPDIQLYIDLLRPRVVGARIQRVRVRAVSLLRTFDPAPEAGEGRLVTAVSRLGKRIVLHAEEELAYVIHLMIAGRLRWRDGPQGAGVKPSSGRIDQASFEFDRGALTLTEAGAKKRATLHVTQGREPLAALDPGGLDVRSCDPTAFASALRSENRTVKRRLTEPRVFDGIGNAYSDEILHAARLSPVKQTGSMTTEECTRLHEAARSTLASWTQRLREEFGLNGDGTCRAPDDPGRFPGAGQITAFRPGFAVHGRYGKPCPSCGTAVQRIVYAQNECNYCPRCQTGGKLLADRAMSRLLKGDWPRTIEELEGAG